MIVQCTAKGARLKSDGFEDPESWIDATLIESENESLVYTFDDVTQIYAHLFFT